MKKRLILFTAILIILGCFALSACAEGVSPVESIAVTVMPVTSYYRGDSFDFNDAAITVYYENGTVEQVALLPSMISDFDSQRVGEQILTVKYGEATTYIKVEVRNAPVYSLAVAEGNYKKTYVQGQELSVKDMSLIVTYTNGFSEIIPIEKGMMANFDTDMPGTKRLVINYLDKSATCDVEVVSKSISNIGLISPDKRNYIVGDKIDLSGGRLHIAYNNNTSEYVDLADADGNLFDENVSIKISGEATDVFTSAGTIVYVTVSYFGFSTEYLVTVEAVKAKNIELIDGVADQPKNSPAIDLSSGTIKITFNNGKEEIISLDDDRVEIEQRDFDISRNGNYVIGVKCYGLSLDVGVKVVEPVAKELVIDTCGKVYYRDGEPIDVTQWKYSVILTNGSYRTLDDKGSTVVAVTEDMLKRDDYDFGTDKAGVKEYEFIYASASGDSVSAKVEVEIFEKYVDGVISFTPPARTVYKVGEELSLDGGSVVIGYNDGSSSKVALTMDMLDRNAGEYTATAGNAEVGFVYSDAKYPGQATFGYAIKVLKEAVSLTLGLDNVKTKYVLGESFDRSGLVVFVHFSDKTTDTVVDFNGAEWSFEGESYSETGVTATRVYYGHKSHDVYADISVNVTNDVVNVRFVDGFDGFGEITEGLDIVLDPNDKLIITRENGAVEESVITKSMLDYDRNDYTLGVRNVTVTYSEDKILVTRVNVVSRIISSASVANEPAKTVYVKGETDFELSGLILTVAYNNGMELSLDGARFIYLRDDGQSVVYGMPDTFSREVEIFLSALDTTLSDGEIYKTQTIAVEVKDVPSATSTASEFNVYVFKNVINNISFGMDSSESRTIEIFEREELVLPDDAFVTVVYEGGATEKVYLNTLREEEYSLSYFDVNSAGNHSVTLSYLRKECSFIVSVLDKKLVGISVNPSAITVKEGMNVSSDDIRISLHYVRNDGTEYSPEYRPEIGFNNVNCTFDPSAVEFGSANSCTQPHEISYSYGGTTVSQTIMITVLRRRAQSVTMQQYPKDVYVENEPSLSLAGGYVMVTYDNGTSEQIPLDSARLSVDDREFDTSEISDGSSRQASIYVRFTDETGNTVEVSFNVTVKDRYYLTADFGESDVLKYNFEYGTGKEARPDFSIKGRKVFGGSEVELINGKVFEAVADPRFRLYYTDVEGAESADWPKDVGLYRMVIEFTGDEANNPYKNDSVTIEILPKKIAVIAENKTLTFGDYFDSVDFGWKTSKYINNDGTESYPEGSPLLPGETDEETVDISFVIKNEYGRAVEFFVATGVDGEKTVINLPVGSYTVEPVLVAMKTDNYEIKSFVSAVLVIEKKDIKIVAQNHEKTYGEPDMRFEYKAYGYNSYSSAYDKLIGGYYTDYDSFGNVTASAQGEIILYGNCKDSIISYTLQREKHENVGSYEITKGADGYIGNYNLAEFVSANLTINKRDVILDGEQTLPHRKYGERYTGELWKNEYVFSLHANESLAFDDSFDEVFAGLNDYKTNYELGNLSIEIYRSGIKVGELAPDETCAAGEYVVKCSIIRNIAENYNVTINDFVFEIDPMEAYVSVKSDFVSYPYEAEGGAMGDGYCAVLPEYTVGYGDNYATDKATAPILSFRRPVGKDVGRYEITISDEAYENNPNFVFVLTGDFYEAWESFFDGRAELAGVKENLPEVSEEEREKAYVTVLPCQFTATYGTSEIYGRKAVIEPSLNFDFDGKTVSDEVKTELKKAFIFGFVNKTYERSGLGYVTADGYDGTVEYDYFKNAASRNFILSGSTETTPSETNGINTENYVAIYSYILSGVPATAEIIFSEKFEYEVLPIELGVNAVNVGFDYTGGVYSGAGANSKGVALSYEAEKLCVGDALNVAYTLNVKYYGRADFEKGEYVREAGDYRIKVDDVGNYNYVRTAESEEYVCEFTVRTIELDVCLTTAIDTDGVMTVKGIYTGRADNRVIDNDWVKGSEMSHVKGYFYTSTQKIVNETSLTTPPNNLLIEPFYEENGVAFIPVNAGTYGFRWKVNAEYVNYSVRFVKETSTGVYEPCEYVYTISPKTVNIMNLAESGINAKRYDGEAPAISDKSKLVIDGDVGADKISADDLEFSFVRDMSFVPDSLENLITADDMTSAGRFIISVSYKKSDNYVFVLSDKNGYYTISRNIVELTLNNTSTGYSLNKQYDTFAPSATLSDLKIASAVAVKDAVYIDLDIKYYKQNSSATWGGYDANGGHPVGLYAYDFKPYFLVPDGGSGNKVTADSVASEIFGYEEEDLSSYGILSWNYYYYISEDSADKNGCDGIYNILPKDIYIRMPDSEYGDFSVDGKTSQYYIHYRTYGNSEVTLTQAQAEINDSSTGYYVSDVDDIKLTSEQLAELGFVRETLILSGSSTGITLADEYFKVSTEAVENANGNFNVLNKDILYVIKKLEVELRLKFVSRASGKSESVYGDADDTDKVFEFADKQAFIEAMGLSDADINDWISYNGGDYVNNKIIIPETHKYGLKGQNGDIRYFGVGVIDAGTYSAYLDIIYAQNLQPVVIGEEFVIKPKAIVINKAERDYFNPSSITIDYFIDGHVNKKLEDLFVAEILKKFSENPELSNTSSFAGEYSDKGYYVYAIKDEVAAVLDGYSNYEVSVNEVYPANSRNDYYYVPLKINKLQLFVTLEAYSGGNLKLKYGQQLVDGDYKLVYNGFPVLEISDDYDYSVENSRQRQVEGYIKDNIIDLSAIVNFLKAQYATTATVTADLNDYLRDGADISALENYDVVPVNFKYDVAKRVLRFTIVNNAGNTFNTEGYISIIAGEKDKLVYSETENGRLNYRFEILNPEEIIGYDRAVHDTIKELLDLTWEGGVAPDNYAGRVRYDIYQDGATLTAGKCKMKLTDSWYSSLNYIYDCQETTVMYYPAVRSIGIQGEGGELPYSAISLMGQEGADYKVNILRNLSMFVRVAYDGMLSDRESSWIDLKRGINTALYANIEHSAAWSIAFAGEEPDSVNIGDEIRLKLTFTESFFGETVKTIESKEFLVRVYGTEDALIRTKAESDFVYNIGAGDVLSNFSELKTINGSYYVSDKDSVNAYSGKFDNVYSEFILGVKNANAYSYEQILFQDERTRLILGFKGGADYGYYVRLVELSSGNILSETEIKNYNVVDGDGNEIERSILADVNVFDGRRHKLNVYVDKVGYLAHAEKTVVSGATKITTTPRKYRVVFVLDDVYSYDIDFVGGNRRMIESSGGTISYEYENYIDFSAAGKTGFVINECTAFIGNFSLKTIGVKMDNEGYVRDVRLWPIDNGSVIYVDKTSSLRAVENLVGVKTINSVDGYDSVEYRYSYVNAVTGAVCYDVDNAEEGFYRVSLTVIIDNKEVYGISFYVCVVASYGDNPTLKDVNGATEYYVYPDNPVTVTAPNGLSVYTKDRQEVINYAKIRFDYSLTDTMGTLKFIFKSAQSGIANVDGTRALALEFLKTAEVDAGGNALFTANVSLSDGSVVWAKELGSVALEGIQNILEVRYDYTNGTIIIRLIRDGEIKLSAKIRRNFVESPSISEVGVQSVIGQPGTYDNGGYSGFYMYKGEMTVYEYLLTENRQNALSLMYVDDGNVSGIGSPADETEISGKNVLMADSCGMALGTTTRYTYLRFRILQGDSFTLMFANNTPYFFATDVTDGTELSGERGAMLEIGSDGIYVSFYKYKLQWSKWRVSGLALADGAEHSIIVGVTEETTEFEGVNYYRLKLVVDGTDINSGSGLFVPVSNDCNGIMSSEGKQSADKEYKPTYESSYDYYFVPDMRYVGIMPGASKLSIEELFVF